MWLTDQHSQYLPVWAYRTGADSYRKFMQLLLYSNHGNNNVSTGKYNTQQSSCTWNASNWQTPPEPKLHQTKTDEFDRGTNINIARASTPSAPWQWFHYRRHARGQSQYFASETWLPAYQNQISEHAPCLKSSLVPIAYILGQLLQQHMQESSP